MKKDHRKMVRQALSVALALSMTAGTTFTNATMSVYAAEQNNDESHSNETVKNSSATAENDNTKKNTENESTSTDVKTDTNGDATSKGKESSVSDHSDPDQTVSTKRNQNAKQDDDGTKEEDTDAKRKVNNTDDPEIHSEKKTTENEMNDADGKQDNSAQNATDGVETTNPEQTKDADVAISQVTDTATVKKTLAEENTVATQSEIPEKHFHDDEGSTDIENIEIPELSVDDNSVSLIWSKPENYADITDYKVIATVDGEDRDLGTASENYKKHADWAQKYREAFYAHHPKAQKTSIHTFTADGLKPDTDYTFTVIPVDKNHEEIGSPISIEAHTRKAWSKKEVHNILDYGAHAVDHVYTTYNDTINEEILENTKAIQAAIDDCGEDEKVVIPKGIYMSGSLYLHSNMTLELEEGAVLEGSPNVDHYDQNYILYPYSTDTRSWSLVNVYSSDEDHPYENIRIVGKGTIDGNGWHYIEKDAKHPEDPVVSSKSSDDTETTSSGAKNTEYYYNKVRKQYISPQYFAGANSKVVGENQGILARDATKKAAKARNEDPSKAPSKIAYNTRPSLVMIRGVRNFYIEGVTLSNPAYHTLAVLDSDTVTSNNVKYLTYDCNNGDGIEIGNTQNATIYNNFFDTGDDAVNFATGMGKSVADTDQQSSSRIWTFDNVFRECHGGAIAAGSHTGAGISDMLVEDNILNYADMPFRFKSAPANGGSIHDVLIRDCAVANADQLFVMTTMYSDSNGVTDTETADHPAEFYNISAYNITCDNTQKNAFSLIADIDPNDPSKPLHHHHNLYFQDIKVTNSAKFKDNSKIDKVTGDVLDGIEHATFYNVSIDRGDHKNWDKIIHSSDLHFYHCDESAQTKNAAVAPEWPEDAELEITSDTKTSHTASASELDETSNDFRVKLKFPEAIDKDSAGKVQKVRYSVETYIQGDDTLIDSSKLFDTNEITIDHLASGVDYLFKVYAYDETGNKVEGPSASYTIDAEGAELSLPNDKELRELVGEVYTSVPVQLADARKADPRIRGYRIYAMENGQEKLKKTWYYYQLPASRYTKNKETNAPCVSLYVDRLTEGALDEETHRKHNDIIVEAFADDGQTFRYNEGTSTTWEMYDFKAPEWSSTEIDVTRDGDDLILSWDDAVDESALLGYRVYVDGKPVYTGHGTSFNHVNGAYTTKETTYTIRNLDLTKDHEFKVYAGDNWWRAEKHEAPHHWTVAYAEGHWNVSQGDEETTDPEEHGSSGAGEHSSENNGEHSSNTGSNTASNGSGRSTSSRSSDSDHDDHDSGRNSAGHSTNGRVLGAHRISPDAMGFWNADARGWKFRSINGEAPVNKWKQCEYNGTVQWYRFDANGYLMSGWFTDADQNIYYLCPLHDGRFGQMLTGWQTINGKEYYFETSGAKAGRMYRNEKTPDGHTVGADGIKL